VLAPLWFGLKLFALICFFILLRASYPRLRYDMLMKFGWKGILPVALANVSLIALSLALQQQLNNRLAGHLIAVAIGAAFLFVLFLLKALTYHGRRKAAAASATTDIVPIRREPVAVSVPAAQPQEV
jgi:lipopolysaccharide export LptBFGC system permease protein LptF